MISLVGRRENSLQRDRKIQRQKGLHIEMRLAAADVRERFRIERRKGRIRRMVELGRAACQEVACGNDRGADHYPLKPMIAEPIMP